MVFVGGTFSSVMMRSSLVWPLLLYVSCCVEYMVRPGVRGCNGILVVLLRLWLPMLFDVVCCVRKARIV